MIFVGGAPVPFIGKLDNRFHFVRLPSNQILIKSIYEFNWESSNTVGPEPTRKLTLCSAVIMGLDKRDEKIYDSNAATGSHYSKQP